MCLILFAYQSVPGYPLVVAANRDEQHARPAAVAAQWSDHPHIYAGRDLQAGGTWLGIDHHGRFAALTNFPGDETSATDLLSRGDLVSNFLQTQVSVMDYADSLEGDCYAGYNLLLFDGDEMLYTSNRAASRILAPGFYGLANAELGAPWPKAEEGAVQLSEIVQTSEHSQGLLDLLADRRTVEDEALPQRGRPIELERRLSAKFILGDTYGTRASTLVYLGTETFQLIEQSFNAAGQATAFTELSNPIQRSRKEAL